MHCFFRRAIYWNHNEGVIFGKPIHHHYGVAPHCLFGIQDKFTHMPLHRLSSKDNSRLVLVVPKYTFVWGILPIWYHYAPLLAPFLSFPTLTHRADLLWCKGCHHIPKTILSFLLGHLYQALLTLSCFMPSLILLIGVSCNWLTIAIHSILSEANSTLKLRVLLTWLVLMGLYSITISNSLKKSWHLACLGVSLVWPWK